MTSCVAIACRHFDGKDYSPKDPLCPECRAHEDHMEKLTGGVAFPGPPIVSSLLGKGSK